MKVTSKHQLASSHFFRRFCVNAGTEPVILHRIIIKTWLGLNTVWYIVAERFKYSKKDSRCWRTRKQPCHVENSKRQAANLKNGGKIMITWYFAVCVCVFYFDWRHKYLCWQIYKIYNVPPTNNPLIITAVFLFTIQCTYLINDIWHQCFVYQASPVHSANDGGSHSLLVWI